MKIGDMFTKWFWDNSSELQSVDVKLNWDGNYFNFNKGRQITFYAEDLFDSQLEAYEWKLRVINKAISDAELDKIKLLNQMLESGINIGNY